ncbi:MAG: PD-(D/E)XK nuclease family protein [bacterium]
MFILEELNFYKSMLDNIRNSIKYFPDKIQKETILSFLNKKYHENTINDYLAYVLNPNKNGIGIKPLYNLISHFDDDLVLDNLDETTIEVNREYSFYNGSRIDILIKINNDLVIGMENKVNSKERGERTD